MHHLAGHASLQRQPSQSLLQGVDSLGDNMAQAMLPTAGHMIHC